MSYLSVVVCAHAKCIRSCDLALAEGVGATEQASRKRPSRPKGTRNLPPIPDHAEFHQSIYNHASGEGARSGEGTLRATGPGINDVRPPCGYFVFPPPPRRTS